MGRKYENCLPFFRLISVVFKVNYSSLGQQGIKDADILRMKYVQGSWIRCEALLNTPHQSFRSFFNIHSVFAFYFLGFVRSIIFLLIESKWFCGTVWLGKRNARRKFALCVFAWRRSKKVFTMSFIFPFNGSFYWGHIAALSLTFSLSLLLRANLSAVRRIMNNSNKLK